MSGDQLDLDAIRGRAEIGYAFPDEMLRLIDEVEQLRARIGPHDRCDSCHGVGTVTDGSTGPMGCPRCNGSGVSFDS